VGRNIEVKARARELRRQCELAAALAGGPGETLHQEDTFFHCPQGRLKLRCFPGGRAELIHYHRPDIEAAAASCYERVPVGDAQALRRALAGALGVRAVVRKQRTLYRAGATRIHLDRVEGLGEFIELEVVLSAGQHEAEGAATVAELMAALAIAEQDLIGAAYVDLLESAAGAGRHAGLGR